MNVTVLKLVDGVEVPVELKAPPVKGLQAWARPRSVPKDVRVLVRDDVAIPRRRIAVTMLHGAAGGISAGERVAVCRGLPKPVKGCEWEVVAVHERGKTHDAVEAVRDEAGALGVAMVLLDSGDRAVKLIDEAAKEILR